MTPPMPSQTPSPPRFSKQSYILLVALAILTSLVFSRVLTCGFVNYDDDKYVTDNPMVLHGFSWASVNWALITFRTANWHPLTWFSLMLDAQVYGQSAFGFHLTNLLIHTLNVILLYWVLSGMTRDVWRSALVAALFAIHPLRVESVAWVSERKDVLSIFWGLIALELYVQYVRSGRLPYYFLGILLFLLSLISKPMLVTMPCLLLLLDVWPLDRARVAGTEALTWANGRRWARLVAEKIPWFLLTYASGYMTYWAQDAGGATINVSEFGFAARVSNAVVAYSRYLGKFIWPFELAVFYPMPMNWSAWAIGGSLALLLTLTGLAIWRFKAAPWMLIGWLWFLGAFVPVIGLVQVGVQSMADRYTYFPLVGLMIAIVWSIPDRWFEAALGRRIGAGAGIGLIGVLSALTVVQIGVWRNNISLWSQAIACTEDNPVSFTNLAVAMVEQGREYEALRYFEESVSMDSKVFLSWFNLGITYRNLRRYDDAIRSFRNAHQLMPGHAECSFDLGACLARQGRLAEARTSFEEAVQRAPDFLDARYSLARIMWSTGDVDAAIEQLNFILKKHPDDPRVHDDLGMLLARVGRPKDGLEHVKRAISAKPDESNYHFHMGKILAVLGDPGSQAELGEAIRLNPKHAGARIALAEEWIRVGRLDEAANEAAAAVRLTPENPDAFKTMGNVLASQGRIDEAVKAYSEAGRLNPQDPGIREAILKVKKRTGQGAESTVPHAAATLPASR